MFEQEKTRRDGSGGGRARDTRPGARSGTTWLQRCVVGSLIGAVGLASAACASGGRERDSGAEVVILVENNLVPGRTVTLLAAPEGRPRTVLGSVAPGETGTFSLRTRLIPHRYRLIAELSNSARLVSRLIQIVSDGATIRWNLELNMVTSQPPEGG